MENNITAVFLYVITAVVLFAMTHSLESSPAVKGQS